MRSIHLALHWRDRDVLSKTTMYHVTDRLHDGRSVQVPGHQIASIVSAWLAELGADSPLIEDLARAACAGDWSSACAVCDQLSVDVAVAAAA
jgi:GH24 family phage-related lysozyme (muramidase)